MYLAFRQIEFSPGSNINKINLFNLQTIIFFFFSAFLAAAHVLKELLVLYLDLFVFVCPYLCKILVWAFISMV